LEVVVQLHALVGGAAEVIGTEATIAEAAERMMDQTVGCLAVVEGRKVVGIITEHDIVSAIAGEADPDDALVADWMTESPDTVPPHLSVREAATWLLETGYRHLPVMDGGELLGVVSIKDVLWALFQTE
jgi:CBS domain-containing protein